MKWICLISPAREKAKYSEQGEEPMVYVLTPRPESLMKKVR